MAAVEKSKNRAKKKPLDRGGKPRGAPPPKERFLKTAENSFRVGIAHLLAGGVCFTIQECSKIYDAVARDCEEILSSAGICAPDPAVPREKSASGDKARRAGQRQEPPSPKPNKVAELLGKAARAADARRALASYSKVLELLESAPSRKGAGKELLEAAFGAARCQMALGRFGPAVKALSGVAAGSGWRSERALALLAHAYLASGKTAKASALVEENLGSQDTYWCYARLLLAFAREGYTTSSLHYLQKAMDSNPHVPPSLLNGSQGFEPSLSAAEFGGATEARIYSQETAKAWARCGSALQWLRSSLSQADDEEEW